MIFTNDPLTNLQINFLSHKRLTTMRGMRQQARMTSWGTAEWGVAAICSLHPRIDPIAMPPKAKTPWQPAHGLEYALEVVSTTSNDNITVWCIFCVYEGRDNVVVDGNSTRKRKSRNDIKYFLEIVPTAQIQKPSWRATRWVMGVVQGDGQEG